MHSNSDIHVGLADVHPGVGAGRVRRRQHVGVKKAFPSPPLSVVEQRQSHAEGNGFTRREQDVWVCFP